VLDHSKHAVIALLALAPIFAILGACGGSGSAGSGTPTPAVDSGQPSPSASIAQSPANLSGTPGNTQVSLTWSQSSGATSYHVKRGTASGGPYAQIGAPTSASYTDTSLANGTTYFYVVSALNSAGESADSSQVSATPVAPASPPVTTPTGQADVTITVTPGTHHAISPYIYGLNFASSVTNAPASLTLDRTGGNRWTAYNWVTNASNAGSDYLYENDAYLSSSTTPGAAVTNLISFDQNHGMASLVTFQMQGLVAADESGPVSVTNPPDLSRFKNVVFTKGSAFTATPSSSAPNVYMDEFIWAIDHEFAGQSIFGETPATQHVFAQLDNEPELWNSTHKEVQGASPVTSDAYIAKTISLATALKKQFPDLVVFAPAHYGFFGLYAWNGELAPSASGSNWFTDKYLLAVKAAAASFGGPLVDVYDFHWYPEATDSAGTRITGLTGPSLSDDQVQAIVQSPRSLWDPTYQEKSWITQTLGGPINILGRLQAKIAAEYPGMKLSITEYDNGGAQHIAGTIAQADNLGVFGVQSLFAATMWPLQANENYSLAGFRAYRNFDGANHNFGDTSIAASSSNVGKVAVYVSTDSSRPGRVVLVAVNRSTATQVTAINGQAMSGTAHLFQMTAATAAGQSVVQPVAAGTQSVSGTAMSVSLPALSVTTIDIY
jgi:Glycoside hydrolase family 44/Fibronectin type III domain